MQIILVHSWTDGEVGAHLFKAEVRGPASEMVLIISKLFGSCLAGRIKFISLRDWKLVRKQFGNAVIGR